METTRHIPLVCLKSGDAATPFRPSASEEVGLDAGARLDSATADLGRVAIGAYESIRWLGERRGFQAYIVLEVSAWGRTVEQAALLQQTLSLLMSSAIDEMETDRMDIDVRVLSEGRGQSPDFLEVEVSNTRPRSDRASCGTRDRSSIAHAVAREFGGEIRVISAPHGIRFQLPLPASRST